jgi:hypothetical protein
MAEEYEWLAQTKAKRFGFEVSDAGLVCKGGGANPNPRSG